MKLKSVYALLLLAVLFSPSAMTGSALAQAPTCYGLIDIANEDLKFTFCPAGDIPHTMGIAVSTDDGDWYLGANPRIYFRSWYPAHPSVVFCNGPDEFRSEYFYPTTGHGYYYTFEFSLAAGIDITAPFDNLCMEIEWGPDYVESCTISALTVRSVDLNGDLKVGLQDVVLFAPMVNNPNANLCADLNGDGVVGLQDIIIFSGHQGHVCP